MFLAITTLFYYSFGIGQRLGPTCNLAPRSLAFVQADQHSAGTRCQSQGSVSGLNRHGLSSQTLS